MGRKISTLIVTLVMCSTSMTALFVSNNDMNVRANPEYFEDTKLDYNLIFNVTENLSKVIYDAYYEGELHKGRAFGSKGELFAGTYIESVMTNLGLSSVHKERIVNISSEDLLKWQTTGNLTTKLDLLHFGLTVNHTGDLSVVDCYISPRWNESIDNKSYDKNELTYNCTYNNLKVIPVSDYSCTDEYLQYVYIPESFPLIPLIPQYLPIWNNIQDSKLVFNISGAMENGFEQYYNFSFDSINPNDNSTFPTFLKNEPIPDDDFVFIEENKRFNPNIQELPSLEGNPNYNEMYQWTFIVRGQYERLLWKAWKTTYPNCKGLIRYDYDNLSFDTGQKGTYFPVIYINGSIGSTIYTNPDEYKINYFVSQQWNTSIESYNIVGQINGSDQSKVVLCGCLYDCMFNSGTIDSAVGVGIMLALAKYLKELETNYGIIPKYTVKFIAYGGEEYGFIGAQSYEAMHIDENIIRVIDMNQVGYNQINPPSIMNIVSNKIEQIYKLEKICDFTNYIQRVQGVSELKAFVTLIGSLSDEFAFAQAAIPTIFGGRSRDISTALILKDMAWYRHHRDGMNHTEGDSMKYVDWNDVNVTSELIWNITKYYTVDPDCRFQTTPTHQPQDTNDDTYYDSVDISFTVNTSMPQDHVKVRAILHPTFTLEHPLWWLLHRYSATQDYVITKNQGVHNTLTISLPPDAPQGDYQLHVFLYNSTGDVNIILDNQYDQGLFADEKYEPSPFYMYPPTSPPTVPDTVSGPQTVLRMIQYPYSTYSSIQSGHIYYQFEWRANKLIKERSFWMGPYDSEDICTAYHAWLLPGVYDVRVRAKDRLFNPNTVTDWSEPLTVTVTSWGGGGSDGCGGGGGASGSNENFYAQLCTVAATQAVGADYSYEGDPYGQMGQQGKSQEFEWFWDFGDGSYSNEQYPTHAYDSVGEKMVTLRINDTVEDDYCILNIPVDVVILKADFVVNPEAAQPNITLSFNDTSAGGYTITDWSWEFGDGQYSTDRNTSHMFTELGDYQVNLTVTDSDSPPNSDTYTRTIHIEETPPAIISVNQSALTIEPDTSIIIDANAADIGSGMQTVLINVTYPDTTMKNFTLTQTTEKLYENYTVTFDETSQPGQYNYTVIVIDQANNTNTSPVFSFFVNNTPDAPLDPYPADGAQNINLNPQLSVYVSNPEADIMNVSFYEWTPQQHFLIDSESDWNNGTFTNTTTDGNGNLTLDSNTAIYGDGKDGSKTFTEDATLTSDKNYTDLTVESCVTLDTAGHTIRVSGTLTNYGMITDSSSESGTGGSGGNSGRGQDPWQNSGGPSTPDNGNNGSPGSFRGGHGGAGGAGGGGARAQLNIYPYTKVDSDGGNGGAGGTGGDGGGTVLLFAFKLNNQNIIHADGGNGENGYSGALGEQYTWGLKDLEGGGGGGGGGGNGGSGGYVNITYSTLLNLNANDIHANGGTGGNGGSRGNRYYDNYATYIGWTWEKFNGGTGYGSIYYGGGGNGEYLYHEYSGYGQYGVGGSSGTSGSTNYIPSENISSGSYYQILDAGAIVDWENTTTETTVPTGTELAIQYGENTTNISGSWTFYSNLSSVPDSRYLKIQIIMSTIYHQISPTIDSINITYSKKLIGTVDDVANGSYAEHIWSGLDLNTMYKWLVKVSDEAGATYGPMWEFTTVDDYIFEITDVSSNPDPVGYGFATDIHANVTEWTGMISSVHVNISYPMGGFGNFTMNFVRGITYEYVFNDTWQNGIYYYTIWAVNGTGATVNSEGHSFNVSANAAVQIATLKDTYGANEYINLTDPPSEPPLTIINRGLTWNTYYNPLTGEYTLSTSQGPLNYKDKNTGDWTPIDNTIYNNTNIISNTSFKYAMTHADYNVFFRERSSLVWSHPVAFLKDDYIVTYTPWETLKFDDGTLVSTKKNTIGRVINDSIVYPGQYNDGIDLKYICQPTGIGEQLIIDNSDRLPIPDNMDASLVLKETIRAYKLGEGNHSIGIRYGLNLMNFKDFDQWGNNSIETTEPVWFTDEQNNTVFYVPYLYAWDSNASHDQLLLSKRLVMTRLGNLRIEILAPWSWLHDSNTTYPVYIDSTTINPTVGASSDDCHESTDGAVYNDTATELHLGKWSGSPTRYYNASLRFNNISIPPGSTVTNAFIRWHRLSYGKLTMPPSYHHYEIHCIDEDNTTTFSSSNKPSQRAYTENKTDWDWSQTSTEKSFSYENTPDISDAVQEVISRSGWESNHSIAVTVLDDGSDLQYKAHSYDYNSHSNPPLLNITYIPSVNNPPNQPSYVYPVNNSQNVAYNPRLNVCVSDDDNDSLTVTWYANTSTNLFSTLHPENNGSSTQLIVHGATYNYQAVDEETPDTNDYVYTQNQDTWINDTYTMQNHSSETADINSVTVYAVIGKTQPMQFGHPYNQYKLVIKINTTWNETTEANVGPTNVNHTWTTNPHTHTAWTWQDIDNLQAGIAFKGAYYRYNKCYQLYMKVNYSDANTTYFIPFQENSSVPSGSNVTAVNQNFTKNNATYWWYVTISDGVNTTTSDMYNFNMIVESKIINTGTTNITGYLLIRVDFWNGSAWVLANDTVNETSPRRINASEQLALDQFFNGKVNTFDLYDDFGNGRYRVYVAFRDPDGNVLVNDDETQMASWYEFEIIS